MKANPKISVILPCYHVEKYLPDIVADLRAQTYGDFEMLFVNDGSGDGLSRQIKEYAKGDDRIVLVEKKNGGVSSARNAGLDNAKGEWVVFVDPDDRVKPYYLQNLLQSVDGTDCVLGVAGFETQFIQQKITNDYTLAKDERNASLAKWYVDFSVFHKSVPWNKIYRLSFLKANDIRFDERLTYCEDRTFCLQIFLLISTIGIARDSGYVYRIEGASANFHYHPLLKKSLSEADAKEWTLLRRLGVEEAEINKRKMETAVINAYMYVINPFKAGGKLSFREKVGIIERDIIQDDDLMKLLGQYDLSHAAINVRLCLRLLRTRKAWLVGSVFNVLFVLKRNFSRLFYWYDAHLSGKFKK